MSTHVIKIGGENASNLKTAEWLAQKNQNGNKIAVTISALRTNRQLKTTDELMRAQKAYNISGMNEASKILENLFDVHMQTLKDAQMYDPHLEEKLRSLFSLYFPNNLTFPGDLLKQNLSSAQEQRFVGYGEVMSAEILSHLLHTRFQVANGLIDHRIPKQNETLSEILKKEVGIRVHEGINNQIIIVPGYVSVENQSILNAYGRGYTDKMAERIAVGLAGLGHDPILHIQKQVALLSSNPNNRKDTRTITDLSYFSAAEITGARGANAQVLNEHTITKDLVENNIPVWVYNPFEMDAPKSIISKEGSKESGIQFIDGRDHVSTISVSGFSMSGPGLLAKVTDLLARKNISIDSIVSSETEFTLTTHYHLDESTRKILEKELQGEIGEDYSASIKNNIGLIYCIGDNLSGHPGHMEKIAKALADTDIDIECLSQSRGQRAVTIGVDSNKLQSAIDVLHQTLIENKN